MDWRLATAGYFETLRIPLVRGRLFTDLDREDAGLVVLINETAARRYSPDQDPVGQRVRTAFEGSAD
ncbi:MAG: ABC transporter permease [Longimicrobiales bacterium]